MNNDAFTIRANLVDVINRRIYPAEIEIIEERISRITEGNVACTGYVMPGFVDAHVHIESSMVTPMEFSREAVRHGTVGTVSDPHEIANVLGMDGVEYMISNAETTPLKILFGAPSCVPATAFERTGASITGEEIKTLLKNDRIGFLSEVMNYPGVIHGDADVMEKIALAKDAGVPIDGHAPGVQGEELKRYAHAGITTDHECFSIEEAREKISAGMYIQIREGSGARNFDTLIPLMKEFPDRLMFCTDDLHPDDLQKGHINLLVKRALALGYDIFDVLRASGHNAIRHYRMPVGQLQQGDPADFILVDDLEKLTIQATYIDGKKVSDQNGIYFTPGHQSRANNFNAHPIHTDDLKVRAEGEAMHVIEAIDGELVTRKRIVPAYVMNGEVCSDIHEDILKIVVVNRYQSAPPAVGFIHGFSLKQGAIASSIAHDSHNIICVGVSDPDIVNAVNWIIHHQGGIVAYSSNHTVGLPLPVGGIMTDQPVREAAAHYAAATAQARQMGSTLQAPFMTLAFMALLVIPELKLSDQGLFDGNSFSFIPLFTSSNG
jgi:adenine deaminase